MEEVAKIPCPRCKGSKEVTLECGNYKGHHVRCWYCQGNGFVSKIDELSGRLFEAMVQDSVNLRQKILWSEVESDIKDAINNQIQSFEESINEAKEEDYIIEEYRGHLERFKEWSDYFLMDAGVIYELRNQDGSEGKWIKR